MRYRSIVAGRAAVLAVLLAQGGCDVVLGPDGVFGSDGGPACGLLGCDEADAGPACVDADGDGYGEGCAQGADCDDTAATCSGDCGDLDASGVPDCREGVGAGAVLYIGGNGGAYDIYEDDITALFDGEGIASTTTETIPSDLVDRYGTLFVLNPVEFDAALIAASRTLLARGGRVVVVTEHGGYGHHEETNAYLTEIGSTVVSVSASFGGAQVLLVADLPPLTEGVSAISMYYCSHVDLGEGERLASLDTGEVTIARETVLRGEVVVISDGSLFGYYLDQADNSRFVLNLARVPSI